MRMRYCARLMYSGKGFCGFQRQNDSPSIQENIERALSTILREEVTVFGCGRTDTGVHAKDFYCHFDTEFTEPESRLFNINGILGDNIVIKEIFQVQNDFHARFDAVERSYEYHIHTSKNPFVTDSSFHLKLGKSEINYDLLNSASELLLNYSDFNTFCKTRSDVNTTKCKLSRSEWKWDSDQMIYHISADRFLRGMVRLTVGALLNISMGKMKISELKECLESKSRLSRDWSVPAHGLYLTNIVYTKF